MTRRALLIGCQTYGLTGCNSDVSLMRDLLERRDFDAIDVRLDGDATRAGILDGLDRLAAAVQPGDRAVVYYSGHGARLPRPSSSGGHAGAPGSTHFQLIVPTDIDATDIGDFRGLLSEELSDRQRRLTEAFRSRGAEPDVTMILDCCHSGYLARSTQPVARAIDLAQRAVPLNGIFEHYAAVTAARANGSAAATNRDAVRMVACQPEQSAFERPSSRGGTHGAMTDALVSVLDELGPARASWRLVADLVRRRVRATLPEQRPELEGPGDRLALADGRLADLDAYCLALIGDRLAVEAGVLLGLTLGDRFRLLTLDGDEVGVAEVADLTGGHAVLRTDPELDPGLAARTIAVPRCLATRPVGVRVVAGQLPQAAADELGEQIDGTRLRLATDGANGGATSGDVQISVLGHADGWEIGDETGAPWRSARYPASDVPAPLIAELETIAVGRRLLDLAPGAGVHALDDAVRRDLTLLADDGERPLAPHGGRLTVGTRVALTLTNTAAEPLYVWVFDVGVSGRSSLVTNAAPSGTRLGAAGEPDACLDVWGRSGSPVFWPPHVPADPAGRWETFVIVTADQRGDLSTLASREANVRGAPDSPLEAVFAEAGGASRDLSATRSGATPLRYRLDTLTFLLVPGS